MPDVAVTVFAKLSKAPVTLVTAVPLFVVVVLERLRTFPVSVSVWDAVSLSRLLKTLAMDPVKLAVAEVEDREADRSPPDVNPWANEDIEADV